MVFTQLGEQLQQKLREHLERGELYRALQWQMELRAAPVGEEGLPQTCYIETMNISAFEPHPRSTTQLSLGYTIIQDAFVYPEEAAKLGMRALTERRPAQFANGWTEKLTLGEYGCFHSGSQLVYTVTLDPSWDFAEGKRPSSVTGGYPSMVKGNKSFSIEDKGNNFPEEAKRTANVLSNSDQVLDIFVSRWLKGYQNKI